MPSSRGYSSYRGRGSKLKVFLAVLLVLVILASAAVIALSRYIAYDENGVPFLRLPEDVVREEPPEMPEEDISDQIIIQEPEPVPPGREPVRAVLVPAGALTAEVWSAALETLGDPQGSYDAVAVTMGDAGGVLYFDAASAVQGSVKTVKGDTAETLTALLDSPYRAIARISGGNCFRVANINVTAMGLKNTGGYIFYDLYGGNWLDPAKPGTVEYLTALAVEAAELGFDEILLTDVGYPTEGKINKIAYTGEEDLSRNLAALIRAVRAALGEREVLLSAELPESVVLTGFDEVSGLRLEGIAPFVDRIYVQTAAEQTAALEAAVDAVSDAAGLVPELDAAPETGERYLVIR